MGMWGLQGRGTASSHPGLAVAGGSTGGRPGRSREGAKGLDLEDDTGCGLASSNNYFRSNRNISRRRN